MKDYALLGTAVDIFLQIRSELLKDPIQLDFHSMRKWTLNAKTKI